MARIFLTGAAGFIGFHLARRLLADGHAVTGFDGLTDYYDVALKRARLAELERLPGFHFVHGMLEDRTALVAAVETSAPDVILHVAAQAGVRYSLTDPQVYAASNLTGTFHLLEAARIVVPRHLLLASTSSVYGGNATIPFREVDAADHPLTFYAATKKANEAMSHSYAHLWRLPTTVLRFFTVYGPWGRPDMALFKFVRAIGAGEPIDVYGHGRMRRDFTYIDDLVEAIARLVDHPPVQGAPVLAPGVRDSLSPVAPWRVVNIAGGRPVGLEDLIAAVEAELGRSAIRTLLPLQPGDPVETHADASLLAAMTGFTPRVTIDDGVKAFVAWYRAYHAGTTGAD
jgi:UDP-glucuronate 4-epimerase